ncbi:MAG: hypothetical protein Q9183_004115 [Haloplaca sp. 2 TL-2023]
MPAFNSRSQGLNGHDGFVAGEFLGAAVSLATPDASSYLQQLERHLAWYHRGVTPFVSVSQNLLRVLRHTTRGNKGKNVEPDESNDWQVALIDLSKVTGSVRAVWETDMDVDLDGIVNADYQRDFRKNVRRAFGEWIVWGGIPASAVLKVVRMADLLAVMGQHAETFLMETMLSTKNTRQARIAIGPLVDRRLSNDDGIAIGRLLLLFGIPERYIVHAVQNLLFDWRYPECQQSAWKTNQTFVKGCNDAYHSTASDFQTLIEVKDDPGSHLKDRVPQSRLFNSTAEHVELLDLTFPAIAEHQNSAVLGTTFADFLSEVEEAVFGE